MGKYDGVVKDFPRVDPTPGPFQEKVQGLKGGASCEEIEVAAKAYLAALDVLPASLFDNERTPDKLAGIYLDLVDAKKALAAAEKPLNAMLAAVEQLMLSAYEEAGIDSITVGGRPVKFDNGLSTKTVDPAAFYAWVRMNQMDGLLTMHSGRIGSITRERVLSGLPIPDGIEVKSWRQAWPRAGANETE